MEKARDSRFLGALGFLGFLGFLGSSDPGFAALACMAAWSGLAVGAPKGTLEASNKRDAGDSRVRADWQRY